MRKDHIKGEAMKKLLVVIYVVFFISLVIGCDIPEDNLQESLVSVMESHGYIVEKDGLFHFFNSTIRIDKYGFELRKGLFQLYFENPSQKGLLVITCFEDGKKLIPDGACRSELYFDQQLFQSQRCLINFYDNDDILFRNN